MQAKAVSVLKHIDFSPWDFDTSAISQPVSAILEKAVNAIEKIDVHTAVAKIMKDIIGAELKENGLDVEFPHQWMSEVGIDPLTIEVSLPFSASIGEHEPAFRLTIPELIEDMLLNYRDSHDTLRLSPSAKAHMTKFSDALRSAADRLQSEIAASQDEVTYDSPSPDSSRSVR